MIKKPMKQIKIKMKLNSSSKVSLQYHSVGLILILIVLKKILAHVNLISIGKYFKGMTKHRIQIHSHCLNFQSEIQNVWKTKFHSKAPMLKYCQKSLNICCFISLASVFAIVIQTKAENSIYRCV